MVLKDKISGYVIPLLIGGAIGIGLYGIANHYIKKRDYKIMLDQALYDSKISRPDALIHLGDINGDRYNDYVILDSIEDRKGDNKDLGRAFIFLGHPDGVCYPIERFSYPESKRKEIISSAEEMARLKNALLSKKN